MSHVCEWSSAPSWGRHYRPCISSVMAPGQRLGSANVNWAERREGSLTGISRSLAFAGIMEEEGRVMLCAWGVAQVRKCSNFSSLRRLSTAGGFLSIWKGTLSCKYSFFYSTFSAHNFVYLFLFWCVCVKNEASRGVSCPLGVTARSSPMPAGQNT